MKKNPIKPDFIEWVTIPKSILTRLGWAVCGLVLVGVWIFILFNRGVHPPTTEFRKYSPTLFQCQGVVVVRRGAEIIPVTGSFELQEGDTVQTGSESTASLKYADESISCLKPNSTVIVNVSAKSSTGETAISRSQLVNGTLSVATVGASPGTINEIDAGQFRISFSEPSTATVEKNQGEHQSSVRVGTGVVQVVTKDGNPRTIRENKEFIAHDDGTTQETRLSGRPVLRAPDNLATLPLAKGKNAEVSFSWTPLPAIQSYVVQIANRSFRQNPSPMLERIARIPVLDLQLPPATAVYYWRVAGIEADGRTGLWSEEHQLQTIQRIEEPNRPIRIDRPAITAIQPGLIEVAGTTEPGVTLLINQVPTLVDNHGKYNRAIELKNGKGRIRLEASDPTGRRGTRTESFP
ncbi:MAG: FecR domain-containing protein [Blastocatellia bacterium]|nr:FecR domain-containing protein [Blastocatellia bacterium]